MKNKKIIWEFDKEEINQKPFINYYNNKQKKSEHWYLNGNLHRENGPAVQFWFSNGQKMNELWFLNGKKIKNKSTTSKEWGVHKTHCCFEHGCKYGNENCPVELGLIKQDYPCEMCN